MSKRKVRFENYSLREVEDGQACRILLDGVQIGSIIGYHENYSVRGNRTILTCTGGSHHTVKAAKQTVRRALECGE